MGKVLFFCLALSLSGLLNPPAKAGSAVAIGVHPHGCGVLVSSPIVTVSGVIE
jgi:hypothetical protein